MAEIAEKKEPFLIKLDPVQFRDLLITIDYVTKEMKNISDRLVAIEAELKLLRMEIAEKKSSKS